MSAARVSNHYKTVIEFTTLNEEGKAVVSGKFDLFFRRVKQSRIDEFANRSPDDQRTVAQREMDMLEEVIHGWGRTDADGHDIAFTPEALGELCDEFYGMRVLLVNRFFETLAVQSPMGNSRR